jgi:branched-chain amino acid transport system ATP-binding protein
VSLLLLAGVSAGYGEIDIISGIDLTVGPREIVTIAGTNGAGKSTLTKAIMGLTARCSGEMTFRDEDLLRRRPEDRIRLGISYVPQVANVFTTLSVLENLQVVEHVADRAARCAAMLEMFPALAARRRVRAGALSGGERQQLAFARALMAAPEMLLLDEPTAALSPNLAAQVFGHIRRLPEMGVAALVVEQRARQSLEISDRGYIIDSGRIVMQGAAAALLADDRMADLYLGRGEEQPQAEISGVRRSS